MIAQLLSHYSSIDFTNDDYGDDDEEENSMNENRKEI